MILHFFGTVKQITKTSPSLCFDHSSQEHKTHTISSYSPIVLKSYLERTLIQRRLRKDRKAMRGVFGQTYKHSVIYMYVVCVAVVVGHSPKTLMCRLLPEAVNWCSKHQPWEAEQPEFCTAEAICNVHAQFYWSRKFTVCSAYSWVTSAGALSIGCLIYIYSTHKDSIQILTEPLGTKEKPISPL